MPAPQGPPTEPSSADPLTALAPVWMRVVAFVAIMVGGLGGALVGGRFGAVACTGACDGVIGTTVVGAVGVAVVAVITLRVAREWVGGS